MLPPCVRDLAWLSVGSFDSPLPSTKSKSISRSTLATNLGCAIPSSAAIGAQPSFADNRACWGCLPVERWTLAEAGEAMEFHQLPPAPIAIVLKQGRLPSQLRFAAGTVAQAAVPSPIYASDLLLDCLWVASLGYLRSEIYENPDFRGSVALI